LSFSISHMFVYAIKWWWWWWWWWWWRWWWWTII